jgi:uncharacterized protein (DUF302 family)
MKKINLKKTINGSTEEVVTKLTDALKHEGFGVLTRIDLDAKIKEKLQKIIPPAVILGACNPQLAYEAYQINTDVASLLPCNAVVREVEPGTVSIELARPSFMMEAIEDDKLMELGKKADQRLIRVLESLS